MRHKIKIFASEITSLTDARYFSAIGAHWLGHYPERTGLSDQAFLAIKPWVVGMKWVLEQKSYSSSSSTLMNTLGIDLLKVETLDQYSKADFRELSLQDWFDLDLDMNIAPVRWVINIDKMPTEYEIIKLKRSAGIHAILLKCPSLSSKQFLHLMHKCHPYGIVLFGSKEEKTGIKSYDAINEVVDIMEEQGWL